MRICFYAPFKPLSHPNPSGDRIIASGLHDFLIRRGHQVLIASRLRSRWIFLRPWLLPQIFLEKRRCKQRVQAFAPDLWLTYHSYYKAPDILGPALSHHLKIPYYIFQGIYSTKQRRSPKGIIGYYLNRQALLRAKRIFSNRDMDLHNLRRIIAPERLSYIKPGIVPQDFFFDPLARAKMRRTWQIGEDEIVIASAAMFRPDVKTQGLSWLIKTLSTLSPKAPPFKLIIAGDGSQRSALSQLAQEFLPGQVLFVGRIARQEMYQFYSVGDLFAFPGIRESLGMVFLEAQSCGLPVVAFDNGGIPEVVVQGKSAFLTPPFAQKAFCDAVLLLLQDATIRAGMGREAASYIRREHDIQQNYLHFETLLKDHA